MCFVDRQNSGVDGTEVERIAPGARRGFYVGDEHDTTTPGQWPFGEYCDRGRVDQDCSCCQPVTSAIVGVARDDPVPGRRRTSCDVVEQRVFYEGEQVVGHACQHVRPVPAPDLDALTAPESVDIPATVDKLA